MELLLLAPLLLMIYSDFRYRNILLWHILLFGVIQIAVCIYKYGIVFTGWNAAINTVILLIIGIVVGTYSAFRFKGKKKPIGMGDILFILFLTPFFDYHTFLYFLITSFIVTLVGWAIWHYLLKKTSEDIPLVSGVGICYTLLLIHQFMVSL